MRSVCVLAPAKVNLTLDIVGKRPDGYHLLESVMQTIALFDTLTVTAAPSGIRLICREDLPQGQDNIVVRAAEAFFREARLDAGAEIRLEKRIPMGAGMGGGSADAAAVLVALDHLYETHWPLERLMALGETLGADVPFCIHGGTAFVQGIGEQIQPLCPIPQASFVVVKPEFSVSTREAFAAADRGEIQTRPDHPGIRTAIAAGDLPGIAARLCNVFEQAVPLEGIEVIRRALREQGALGSVMTGSGSAVIGVFPPDPEQAARAAHELQARFPEAQTFAVEEFSQGPCIISA